MPEKKINEWFACLEVAGLKNREGQRIMAQSIAVSISEAGISVVEGGTGIGKSFAALFAALAVRKQQQDNGEEPSSILYSTGTIALQNQLINKDLPAMNEMLGLDLCFGIAKGRNHYICPRKTGSSLRDNKTIDMFEDDGHVSVNNDVNKTVKVTSNVQNTVSNLYKTLIAGQWNGDIDALDEALSYDVINTITVPHGACLKKKCSEYKKCPFYRARNALRKCDVIVTNHDLLLCDLALGGGKILPCPPSKTDYLIDEAHRFPDTAVKQLGGRLSITGIYSWLDSFGKTLNRHFQALVQMSPGVEAQLRKAKQQSEKAVKASKELIPILDANQSMFTSSVWMFERCPESLHEPLLRLHAALENMSELLESVCDEVSDNTEFERLYVDMGFFNGKVSAALDATTLTLVDDQDGQPPIARWIEFLDGYLLNAYPTFASHRLSEMFWKKARSISCFSATLRSVGLFERFLSESGLKETPRHVKTLAVESNFDYNKSGLYLMKDGANPQDKEEHISLLTAGIKRAISNVKGGILVLFTSKIQLGAVYDRLLEQDVELSKIILRQGDIPREKLVRKHKKRIKSEKKSCIFGLASFGEGVDLPGNLCTSVIIARIPFPVPTTPMELARVDWIKKCGGNPFWDYSLPVASIRLTQLVGRLVRTESDKGSVVIMDDRIVRREYGKMLISNLPPMSVKMVSGSMF